MFRSILIASSLLAIVLCGRDSGEFGPARGSRPRPPGRHAPLPPYLRNITEEARREYFEIERNRNETISKQKEQVQQWGQKYGVLDQVNEFDANITRFKTELNQNVTELISQLSQGQQQLNQIMDNENQTRDEQRQAIEAFRNQSRNVFDTLMFMGGLSRPRGRHGPDGDFGGRGGPRGGPEGPGPRGNQGQRGGPSSFGGDRQGFQQGPGSFGAFGQHQGGSQGELGGF